MSEEDVGKRLAEVNQSIYLNKLLIDLDQNYENLKIVIENIINLFNNELINKTYEILLEDETVTTRENISGTVKDFFTILKNHIITNLDSNKKVLESIVVTNDFMKYVNQIETMTGALCESLSALYKSQSTDLINNISKGLSYFSRSRIENLVNEILFNRFIIKVKSSLSDVNLILINNYQENNNYLEHMNEKTGLAII